MARTKVRLPASFVVVDLWPLIVVVVSSKPPASPPEVRYDSFLSSSSNLNELLFLLNRQGPA